MTRPAEMVPYEAASALRQALLSPQSVAIVGQSNDTGKTAGRPLKYLRQADYAGRIYPINPGRETVLGERAWPSLAALPEAPDHAYIVTPTEPAIAAVAECGRLGVKVATVLAAFDEKDLPVGRMFAASHSGSMIGALLSRGKARGIGFAGLVSVGNEVDLSLGEICELTLDDPDIDGYMLFLETMRNMEALRRFALAAAAHGKPVIAYKLGRSLEARELAVSHTGALAGEDDVADAFLAACGIARVDTLDGLIEGLPLIARKPARKPSTPRGAIGVLTTTGGGATMVVDPLARRGVAIEPPSAETLGRLTAAGIAV